MMVDILFICSLIIVAALLWGFVLRTLGVLAILFVVVPFLAICLLITIPVIFVGGLFGVSARTKIKEYVDWVCDINDKGSENDDTSYTNISSRGSGNTMSGGSITINGRRVFCDLCTNTAHIVMDDIKRCKDCLRKKNV